MSLQGEACRNFSSLILRIPFQLWGAVPVQVNLEFAMEKSALTAQVSWITMLLLICVFWVVSRLPSPAALVRLK